MDSAHDIHVALAADQTYFPGLALSIITAVCSLPRSERARLSIWVIDGGIADESWGVLEKLVTTCGHGARIIRVPFLPSLPAGVPLMNNSSLAYSRIFLSEILSIDQVIYLDCDLLVFRDLRELWNTPFENAKLILAARDPKIPTLGDELSPRILTATGTDPHLPYFNSGVFLANLRAWRSAAIQQKTLDLLRSHPADCFTYWDQSALNITCAGSVQFVGAEWNRLSQHMPLLPAAGPNAILHFASEAPFLRCKPYPSHWLYRSLLRRLSVPWNTSLPAYRKIKYLFFFRKLMPFYHRFRGLLDARHASRYAWKEASWRKVNRELDEVHQKRAEQWTVVNALVHLLGAELDSSPGH